MSIPLIVPSGRVIKMQAVVFGGTKGFSVGTWSSSPSHIPFAT